MNKRIIALGSSICMTAALLVATQTATAPHADAASGSPYSYSYYVKTYDTNWAYSVGQTVGTFARDTAGTQYFTSILDFGVMYLNGSTWMMYGFGTQRLTLAQAGEMVYQFGRGFYNGSGADDTSLIYIGLGTSSYGSGTVTAAAGAALAGQAASTDQRFTAFQYRQLFAVGANDFEGGTGWASSAADRKWFDGYMGRSGRPILFNYGGASNCPQTGVPSATSCRSATQQLSADDIWYLSWSGAAYPVPEVYTTDSAMAKQWKWLSIYSHDIKKAGYFTFQGLMTQWQACNQTGKCVSAERNTPATAYGQLALQLNSAPVAGGAWYISKQPTDIRYQ